MAWEAIGLQRRLNFGRNVLGIGRKTPAAAAATAEHDGSAFGIPEVEARSRDATAQYLQESMSNAWSDSSSFTGRRSMDYGAMRGRYVKSCSNLSHISSLNDQHRPSRPDRATIRKSRLSLQADLGLGVFAHTEGVPIHDMPPSGPRSSRRASVNSMIGLLPDDGAASAVRLLHPDEEGKAQRQLERQRRASIQEIRTLHLEYAEEDHMWRHKKLKQDSLVDSSWGRMVVGTILVLDLARVGALANRPTIGWDRFAALFAAAYISELCLRVHHFGLGMFTEVKEKGEDEGDDTGLIQASADAIWNMIALILVASGLAEVAGAFAGLDQWCGTFLNLRLLRGIRFFTLNDKLRKFGGALVETATHLTWIFVLFGIVTYALSIFFKRMLDHIDVEGSEDYFRSVQQSAYSLFQIITMDNWRFIIRPLVRHNPLWACFFVIFIMCNSYVMISLLNALVCERVISATGLAEIQAEDQKWHKLVEFALFLEETFAEGDVDGNGVLDKDEFLQLIQEDHVKNKIEELGVQVSHQELVETWDMLDVDESGELTITEFTSGLWQLQQDIGMKHILSINCVLQRFYRRAQQHIADETLRTSERLSTVQKCVDGFEERLLSQAGLMKQMDSLDCFMQDLSGL